MIIIIDYNMGNSGSIQNMLKYLGYSSLISSDPKDIQSATKLILPGVGSFDNGVTNLQKVGLIDIINKKVLNEKTPILGICLGMQLFTQRSEEGKLAGLNWIKANTIKFNFNENSNKYKIPHMGWNIVKIKKSSQLFNGAHEEQRYYFVHSYHVVCEHTNDILTTTPYGFDFTSSVECNNIFGVQFHPEKSHKFGMNVLKNFIDLV